MTRTTDSRQGFTLVELLVVIAIIAIIAGLVVPSLMSAQGRAYMLQCKSNLRGLQNAAFSYATNKQRFPIADGKEPAAHESLNSMLNSSAGAELEPAVFVCPEGEALEAPTEEDDQGRLKFILEAENNDYMWVKKPTRTTTKGALSADKYYKNYEDEDGIHQGHSNTLQLVDTSGRVLEVDVLDTEELEKNRIDPETYIPRGLTR